MNKFNIKTYEPGNQTDWLIRRNEFISATQIAFVLSNFCVDNDLKERIKSITPSYYYTSKYGFFHKKTMSAECLKKYNYLDRIINPQKYQIFKIGLEKEKEIAEYAFNTLKTQDGFQNSKLIPNGKKIFYIEDLHISATPDFLIEKDNGQKTLIECKTCAYRKPAIIKSHIDKLTKFHALQVACQMLCTGIQDAYVAFGVKNITNTGILKYDIRKIEFSEFLQKNILEACQNCFDWMRGVENGTIGAPDPETADDALIQKAIYEVSAEKECLLQEKKAKTIDICW